MVYAELIIVYKRTLVLTHSIPFSSDAPADFFMQFPATAAVFALRGADENAEPYVSKAANLQTTFTASAGAAGVAIQTAEFT